MTTQPLLTVCAWCDRAKQEYSLFQGTRYFYCQAGALIDKPTQSRLILGGHTISHGICPECRDKQFNLKVPE